MENSVKARSLILTGAACAAVGASLTTAIAYGFAGPDSHEDQASASANTNELTGAGAAGGLSVDELRIEGDSDGPFPLLLPIDLPEGNTTGLEFLGPIARDRSTAEGTWITTYAGSARLTTDGTVASYEVYQDASRPAKDRCPGQETVAREVSYAWLTICLGSNADATAVEYWNTVQFTPHPDDLPWIG